MARACRYITHRSTSVATCRLREALLHHYLFYPEHNLVVTTFVGSVAKDDFLSLYRDLYSDPAYILGMDELVDLRPVTKFEVGRAALDEVRQIVEARYSASPDTIIHTAIVAPTDHHFGIGRMYEALSSDTEEEVYVFRNLQKALEWLRPDAEPELASLLDRD